MNDDKEINLSDFKKLMNIADEISKAELSNFEYDEIFNAVLDAYYLGKDSQEKLTVNIGCINEKMQ